MSRLTEKFSLLTLGDKFRLITSLSFFLLGAAISVRGLSIGFFPVLIGLVFFAFGAYRLYYFYRFFGADSNIPNDSR